MLANFSPTSSQTVQRESAVHDRINVVVETQADALQMCGLSLGDIRYATEQAVRVEGWEIEPSSKYNIRVVVTPLQQYNEDLFPYQIEVRGVVSDLTGNGRKMLPLHAKRIVEVSMNDVHKLIDEVDEMVRSVSYKFKKRIPRNTNN